MSWRAIFIDGPLEGQEHDREFMGSWQRELWFAHIDRGDNGASWILVGGDGWPPRPCWPEQIHYVRNDERSCLTEKPRGEDEGWAAYELATGDAT